MHSSVATLAAYLHGVVGFMVVEEHLGDATSNNQGGGGNLVDGEHIQALWGTAQGKVVNNIRNQTSYITDTQLLLDTKKLLMLFADTLQSYGLAVSGVHELLFELRDHYTEVLMSSWLAVFQQVFQEDNYHPISVATQGEYQRITEMFAYHEPGLESQ